MPTAVMLIHVDDHLLDDLCAHFERCGFSAERHGNGVARVALAGCPDGAQERREVELHLHVFRARNPGANALATGGG